MDKVHKGLARWKRNCLSFAGRVKLFKFVIATIPSYAMQTTLLPKSVINEVERCTRRFLWGEAEGCRKLHHVNWEIVMGPRSRGLGTRRLQLANKVALAKLG